GNVITAAAAGRPRDLVLVRGAVGDGPPRPSGRRHHVYRRHAAVDGGHRHETDPLLVRRVPLLEEIGPWIGGQPRDDRGTCGAARLVRGQRARADGLAGREPAGGQGEASVRGPGGRDDFFGRAERDSRFGRPASGVEV